MSLREAAFPRFRLRAAISSLSAPGGGGRSAAPPVQSAVIGLAVALAYYAGSQVGFLLTPSGTPIATFWPPNAILLAALLLTSRRIWWVLVLAVLPAHLFVQLRTGIPLASALAWLFGNDGEALLGAVCVRAFTKDLALFDSVRGLLV